MTESKVLHPHSEYELTKSINLEVVWLGSPEAEIATLEVLREHLHKLRGLQEDLRVERFVQSQKRVPDAKQSRSWHR